MILPGTYRLRNSVFLQSNVRLLGSGRDTVLFKEPSAKQTSKSCGSCGPIAPRSSGSVSSGAPTGAASSASHRS